MLKIRGAEVQQALTELAMQAAGPGVAPFKSCGGSVQDCLDPWLSGLAPRYLNTRKVSIYGGSNEIQRNTIAKMTLGL